MTVTLSAPAVLLGDLSALCEQALGEIFDLLEQAAEWNGAKAVAWPFVDVTCQRLLDYDARSGQPTHV